MGLVLAGALAALVAVTDTSLGNTVGWPIWLVLYPLSPLLGYDLASRGGSAAGGPLLRAGGYSVAVAAAHLAMAAGIAVCSGVDLEGRSPFWMVVLALCVVVVAPARGIAVRAVRGLRGGGWALMGAARLHFSHGLDLVLRGLRLLVPPDRLVTVAVRGRPLRILSELAGLLGAEITGTIGFAACAGLFALIAPTTWVPFVALPVVLAAAGPAGYDMAQSWVPEDERLPDAPAGFRVAVHAAGVAAALLLAGAVVAVANVAPSGPTAMMAMLVFLGLPYLAAVSRNVAVWRLSGSKALLPAALGVIVAAAPALFFGGALILGRLSGDD